jgi:hypothetical protein
MIRNTKGLSVDPVWAEKFEAAPAPPTEVPIATTIAVRKYGIMSTKMNSPG